MAELIGSANNQTVTTFAEAEFLENDCCNIMLFEVHKAINSALGEKDDRAAMFSSISFDEPSTKDFQEAFPECGKIVGVEHMYYLINTPPEELDVEEAFQYIKRFLKKAKLTRRTLEKWYNNQEDLFYKATWHVFNQLYKNPELRK